MMVLREFVPIWLAYFLAAASPGPAQIFIVENATLGTRDRARWAALGVTLGTGVWVLLVAFGLSRLVNAFAAGPTVLRYGSIALLAYFFARNVQAVVKGRRRTRAKGQPLPRESTSATFGKGFLVNLLNPNSVVFFLSLFAPLLLATHAPRALVICISGVMLISVVWYQTIALLASRPRFQRALSRSETALRIVFALVYLYFLVKVARA